MLQRLGVFISDGADAKRPVKLRYPLSNLGARPIVKFGMFLEVTANLRTGAGVRRSIRLSDPRQPVLDVKRVTDFAHFAIADNVDAASDLSRDDVLNICRCLVSECLTVKPDPLFLCFEEVERSVGPWQTADVRSKDAFRTVLHIASPLDFVCQFVANMEVAPHCWTVWRRG